jgi:RNA polymerase sigma-70 factor (ECF subfamily)
MTDALPAAAIGADDTQTVDAPSFDVFFVDERDHLYGALCLVTRDRGEAEDIAQEAFVRVLEHWERVGAMDNPAGYLYRTAMNQFRRRYRRRLLAARRSTSAAPSPDPFEAVDLQDEAIRALATLSERQRACIVLTELLGYPSEEAAHMLGIRASTVRAHTTMARAALRAKVGEDG